MTKLSSSSLLQDTYELIEPLGKGGYGTVWKVRNKNDGLEYACKTVPLAQKSETEKQCLEALSSQGGCCHKSLWHLQGTQVPDSEFESYYIGPLLQAFPLYKCIWNVRMNEVQARYYISQILSGLFYLHRTLGFAHRDLKSGNVMMEKSTGRRVWIIDYGFSFPIDGEKKQRVCGTPYIRAPEMLSGVGYDERIDYWAVGVLLYEVLNQRPPWASYDPEPAEILNTNYTKIFDKPCFKSVSPECLDFITLLLKPDPEQRLTERVSIQNHPWFKYTRWESDDELSDQYIPRVFEFCSDSSDGADSIASEDQEQFEGF